MRFRNYKPYQHKGCWIYIRQCGTYYEYLTSIHGQIYANGRVITGRALRGFIKMVFHLIGKPDFPLFTPKQSESNVKYMKMMAETTVETILNIKHKK